MGLPAGELLGPGWGVGSTFTTAAAGPRQTTAAWRKGVGQLGAAGGVYQAEELTRLALLQEQGRGGHWARGHSHRPGLNGSPAAQKAAGLQPSCRCHALRKRRGMLQQVKARRRRRRRQCSGITRKRTGGGGTGGGGADKKRKSKWKRKRKHLGPTSGRRLDSSQDRRDPCLQLCPLRRRDGRRSNSDLQ